MPSLDVRFSEQSQRWLEDLAKPKRKPVSSATLRAFGSYVRRLTPMIGATKLVDVGNGFMKALVMKLGDDGLSPKTIAELIAVVKQVVASVVDQNGNQLFPRTWSAKHIDAPTISKQRQPCITLKELQAAISDAATDQERVLYCVLAGSGLRIAEALAIHVAGQEDQTSWTAECAAIEVRSSIFNGREVPRLKTLAAKRTVDLDSRLSDLIAQFVKINGIRRGDHLFQARSGRPTHLKTARHRLAKRNIPGFHSFRRFRITRLRELGVAEDILKFWAGHSGKGITDRYSKLAENTELRKQWAEKVALGFDIPELCAGHPAPEIAPKCDAGKSSKPRQSSSSVQSSQPVAPSDTSDALEPQPPSYVAEDSDLPELFFEASEHAV